MARPMANDPPFATLNHFEGDSRTGESDFLRIGITRMHRCDSSVTALVSAAALPQEHEHDHQEAKGKLDVMG
jgi:hypothetical protein